MLGVFPACTTPRRRNRNRVMQIIPLKMASPGMVLARSVEKSDGMVLVGEGMTLTEALIARFQSAGIASVAVKGRPFPDLPGGEDIVLKTRVNLDVMFRKHRQDPLMWTLRNMIDKHLEQILERDRLEQLVQERADHDSEPQ